MNSNFPLFSGRILAPFALFEWGTILTYFYCSNRLAAFLHPSFRPLVLVTGILLLVSAGCVLLFNAPDSPHGCDEEQCGHLRPAQTPRGLVTFAVLVIPIALAAKLSPDSFSVAFIQNRGILQSMAGSPVTPASQMIPGSAAASDATASHIKARDPEAGAGASNRPRSVSILELMLAAQDEWCQPDFDGKRVELIGRYFPQETHHFDLVCTLITCCAADAQTLGIRINTDDPPKLGNLAWVRVVGCVSFSKQGEHTVPMIAAEKITAIQSPKEQYTYRPYRPKQSHFAHH